MDNELKGIITSVSEVLAEVTIIKAERDRYREALEAIARTRRVYLCESIETLDKCKAMARKALEGK